MPARSKKAHSRTLDDVLSRLGAKLEAWQVRALFLGAQTSTNMRLGPQHLLSRIFGEQHVLGDDIADANANLQALMALWNDLVADHQADLVVSEQIPLVVMPRPAGGQNARQQRARTSRVAILPPDDPPSRQCCNRRQKPDFRGERPIAVNGNARRHRRDDQQQRVIRRCGRR